MRGPAEKEAREPPQNVELEQALLGAILTNNEAFGRVSPFLAAEHFYEPLHGRLFDIIAELVGAGKVANPVTLKTHLPDDIKKIKVGNLAVAQYVARLAAEATTVVNVHDYARGIFDLARRRRIIEIAEDFRDAAFANDPDLHARAADAFGELAKAGNTRNGEQPLPKLMSKRDFLAGFTPPDFLIDGVLQRRFLYSLTGGTGHAKTAIALLIAQLVSSCEPAALGIHQVQKGKVVYFVGENPDDVRMRIIGADAKREDDTDDEISFLPGVFSVEQMRERLASEMEKIGGVSLIIVDTSAAYFLGNDEISNPQMGNHARMLRTLTTLPGGPCVLVLCHPIKHVTDPDQLLPRGGGAFLAEVDGNLTAWRDGDVITLHYTGKIRGPGFEPITFRLDKITTTQLTDSQGRLIPTSARYRDIGTRGGSRDPQRHR
jgi:replicative DNA helicase